MSMSLLDKCEPPLRVFFNNAAEIGHCCARWLERPGVLPGYIVNDADSILLPMIKGLSDEDEPIANVEWDYPWCREAALLGLGILKAYELVPGVTPSFSEEVIRNRARDLLWRYHGRLQAAASTNTTSRPSEAAMIEVYLFFALLRYLAIADPGSEDSPVQLDRIRFGEVYTDAQKGRAFKVRAIAALPLREPACPPASHELLLG